MIIVFVYVILAFVIAAMASDKGRSGVGWFLLSLCISPVLALLFLAVAGDTDRKRQEVQQRAFLAMQAKAAPPPQPTFTAVGRVVGDGDFRFPIVGESHYQAEIRALVGDVDAEDGARDVRIAVTLSPEPTNPYDPGAVVVRAANGTTLGYLARDVAPLFVKALAAGRFGSAAADGMVEGGWNRGPGDRANYGVRLNAALPFSIKERHRIEEPAGESSAPVSPMRRRPLSWRQAGLIAFCLIAFTAAGLLVAWQIIVQNRVGSPAPSPATAAALETAPVLPVIAASPKAPLLAPAAKATKAPSPKSLKLPPLY